MKKGTYLILIFSLVLCLILMFIAYLQSIPSEEDVFNAAEKKLVEFLEIYNQLDEGVVNEKYIEIGGQMKQRLLPQNPKNIEIVEESIEKRINQESGIVLDLIANVIFTVNEQKESYRFIVSFYSPSFFKIDKGDIKEASNWIIGWRRI